MISRRMIPFFSLLVVAATCLSVQPLLAQLTLKWYAETPPTEDHVYRAIAVDNAGKYFYISDSETDLVYIFRTDQPGQPIGSFGDPSWQTPSFGPYGIDMSPDGNLYIAVWIYADANGDGNPDHGLWRYKTKGGELELLCFLPDAPRGLKVVGAGATRVIYVSGTDGNVIRCSQLPGSKDQWTAELLFNTGVTINQQTVLSNRSEEALYVSSWSYNFSYTPFLSQVTKWNPDGERDPSFSVEYLPSGNLPGMEFDAPEKVLFLFHIGTSLPPGYPQGPLTDARIYKVNAETGDEIENIVIGAAGGYAGANIDCGRNGDIYFARTFDFIDGHWISAYGMVASHPGGKKPKAALAEAELLCWNYPNPFNPSTTFAYQLPKACRVTLKIFNELGQEVAILVEAEEEAGAQTVRFDASALPSGMYFYRLQAGDQVVTNKLLLLK